MPKAPSSRRQKREQRLRDIKTQHGLPPSLSKQPSLSEKILEKNFAANLTRQMRDVLPPIDENPEAFEQFSEAPLEKQMEAVTQVMAHHGISGGGQKGGAPSEVINGFVTQYIKPAWQTAVDSTTHAKDYVKDIALNYMDQIRTLAAEAGLGGVVPQQNLHSIIYGLTVLAAAWNMGLIQMIPGLTLYLINMLSSIATTAAALPKNLMFQNALTKITAVAAAYRYRGIPIGAYGVISSAVAPVLTALYARGDQAFQDAFPDFGQNIAAGGAERLQALKQSLADAVDAGRDKLRTAVEAAQPGIAAIKGVGTAWRNYVNESIQTLIQGLVQAKTDIEAVRAYYTFLENVGRAAREQGVVIPPPPPETIQEIADLIGHVTETDPNVDNTNNLVTGAVAIGDLISDELNPENPIEADEAAALLLALGNIGGNVNVGPPDILDVAGLGPGAAAAAAAPAPINIGPPAGRLGGPLGGPLSDLGVADLGGGKALRRRRRRTAKKSHKKKHTKKHSKRKVHKGKSTKGKKGKNSKRHTKRRS